ncbi:MAG: ABC transporter permease [Gemmatimonadetes bacterium]|nr:ABC transporter permease [Gemmatimonadota bacterium]
MRAKLGAGIVVGFAALALAAPAASLDGTDVVLTRFLPPGAVDDAGVLHLLGTDRLGRDVLSRLLHGARVSLAVALLATVVSLAMGVVVGTSAAILGPRVRAALLGITDFALALPRVVLLLLLAALWQPSAGLVIATLGLTGWMPLARLVYAESAAQLGRPYVGAAQALGGGRRHTVVRHILPNIGTTVLAAAALGVGQAITLEAGLSFLGLGVQPPTPSWGALIASGRETIVNAPWVGLAPGIALVILVLACSMIADGLGQGNDLDRHQLSRLRSEAH